MQETSTVADVDCRVRRSFHSSKNLIHFVAGLLTARWFEVAHRAFDIRVTEPILNRAKIDTRTKAPSRESCPEFVKPEVFGILFGTLGNSFQVIEEIHLHIASSSRKHESTTLV